MEEETVMLDPELEAPLVAKLEALEAEESVEEEKVEDARRRAAEIVEEADQKRRKIADQRKRIDRALKSLRGEPLTAPKPKAKPTRSWTPSDEVVGNVREAARRAAEKSEDGGFFFYQLQEESPHSDVTTQNALDVMREGREVRRAGQREAGERRGRKDYFFLDLISETEEPAGWADPARDEEEVSA